MHAYLLPCMNFGPVVIERVVGQLSETDHDRVLAEGRFTPREVVAHLADWEPIMLDRIRAAVETPGATIQAYDEAQMAIDHHYAKSDIREQARLFRQEREKTTAYLKTLTPEAWKSKATHAERGPQSTEDLAGTLIGHDMYHIEQLSAYLR